ncbi:YpoC family protein [Mangrovibacillus cuniculi]|uniref:YpoC-like domain-containing protein n=1 Tax=Mangrovibacillus cuniculi TaxID=2593652 RepID=A0A7S8CAZ7_9BACI|nr:hypothetical protein [Mangrovibacillus cuniculi]QPC46666.1 hypothetical protein G8O30_06675 [Mangrovibacillus cuniculi]
MKSSLRQFFETDRLQMETQFMKAYNEGIQAINQKEYLLAQDSFHICMIQFQELLLQSNGLEKGREDIPFSTLSVFPLNLEERWGYIHDQAGRYTSFIQLNELFREQVKKIASAQARNE